MPSASRTEQTVARLASFHPVHGMLLHWLLGLASTCFKKHLCRNLPAPFSPPLPFSFVPLNKWFTWRFIVIRLLSSPFPECLPLYQRFWEQGLYRMSQLLHPKEPLSRISCFQRKSWKQYEKSPILVFILALQISEINLINKWSKMD